MRKWLVPSKWLVLVILGLVAFVSTFVLAFYSVLTAASAPRTQLSTGKTVTVMEGYDDICYEYYGEIDLGGPLVFTFTNTATGEKTSSKLPVTTTSYAISSVNGMLVGNVELAPGEYLVEYDVKEEVGGSFIITDNNAFKAIFKSVILFFVGTICLTLTLLAFVKHYDTCRRRFAEESTVPPTTTERTDHP
jgi:hypothetical protein